MPTKKKPPPWLLDNAMAALVQIRNHAIRAPFPDPEMVARSNDRRVLVSSFAMIRQMAQAACEAIAERSDLVVPEAPDPPDQSALATSDP
jgi:hypothetical protein